MTQPSQLFETSFWLSSGKYVPYFWQIQLNSGASILLYVEGKSSSVAYPILFVLLGKCRKWQTYGSKQKSLSGVEFL